MHVRVLCVCPPCFLLNLDYPHVSHLCVIVPAALLVYLNPPPQSFFPECVQCGPCAMFLFLGKNM